MNREMMHRIADAIEAGQIGGRDVRFNMYTWVDQAYDRDGGHWCGTAACVAGYAYLYQNGAVGRKIRGNVKLEAQDILDLSDMEARHLFVDHLGFVTRNRELVPDALRWMAETGQVSWSKGFEYARCVEKKQKAYREEDWVIEDIKTSWDPAGSDNASR